MFYPDPITDEDLLAQAKELLAKARELTAEEKKQDWRDAFFNFYSITLLRASTDEEGARYCLCGKNGADYVLIESGDWEDRENLKYTPVAALSDGASEALLGLARQQYNRNNDPQTTLTDKELAWFNEVFFNGDGFNFHNQFLTSLYARPEDIDLYELFYCGDGKPSEGLPATEEEWQMVWDLGNGGHEPDCAASKQTHAELDQALLEHMGLSLDQTNKVGLDGYVYLPEYDAYYDFHGDTNYYTHVAFYSGVRRGAVTRLYYHDAFLDRGRCVLTLREVDGNYLFVSNQKIASEEQTLSVLLHSLAGDEISGLSGGPGSGSVDKEQLARAVRTAAASPIAQPENADRMTQCNLWEMEVQRDGEPYLRLSAGRIEDVVEIQRVNSNERGYFKAPKLYQMVRKFWTPTADQVVQADLDQMREPIVDWVLERELEKWNLEFEENGLDAQYTGVNLTQFYLLSDWPDLLKGADVKLYAMDYGLSIDDLEDAAWVGGAYADGTGLFHPYGAQLHLLAIEWDDGAASYDTFLWEFLLQEGEVGPDVTPDYVPGVIADQLRNTLDPVVPDSGASQQAVAEEYGEALADYYLSLGSSHPNAVTYAQLVGAEVYEQSEEALCANITLAVDPLEPNTVHWVAGAGIDRQTEGPWAGHWLHTLEYRLERIGDGWVCTERGTGGIRLP